MPPLPISDINNPLSDFVIQEHQTPDGVHWDLMLQEGDTLRTWRMNSPPRTVDAIAMPLERIHDHPLRFLTYEGPVQNNTSRIHIVERGRFKRIAQTPSQWSVVFDGVNLKGPFLLRQTNTPTAWALSRL